MNGQIFVCNASPLIGFQRLQRLDLLQTLTDQLLIPQAVRQEVFSGELPHWIVERAGSQSISPWTLSPRFGAGEREAIALALEIGHCILLLDDLAARRTAQSLHIEVLGTIGLLIEAR